MQIGGLIIEKSENDNTDGMKETSEIGENDNTDEQTSTKWETEMSTYKMSESKRYW